MSEALRLLLWGALGVGLLQLAFWLWHLRKDNASWVDVGWALGLGGLAVFYALAASGDPARRLLAGAMGGLWGLRLGVHLWLRVARDPHEDGRYQEIRKAWGGAIRAKFLAFFQAQALLDVLLSVPFLLACLDPEPGLSPLVWLGLGIWTVSMVGEGLADAQLQRFKADPAHRGLTCRAGLWRYSRHPNYFFEWLVWIAFALVATPSPWGWTAWACPALMLYFLLRVTGIPYTEAQSLRSRPEDYARYQRETSAFLPWFPKVP
jgi:steroid 5-alpha reductase family enzyme